MPGTDQEPRVSQKNSSSNHLPLDNNEQPKLAVLQQELVLAWQRVSRQKLLNKIIQAMRGTLVLDEILQTTVNQLQVALKVSHCLIFRPNSQRQMAVRYTSDVTVDSESLSSRYGVFYSHYQEILALGQSVVLSENDETLPPEILLEIRKNHIQAMLIVPLLYQNSYIGGISLVQCDQDRTTATGLGASATHDPAIEDTKAASLPWREIELIRQWSLNNRISAMATEELAELLGTALTSATAQPPGLLQEDYVWEWGASDQEFIQAIADHCAIAIYQAELYQQLQAELAERQQVEEALRQSETRYRAIVEDQSELICRFKPNGTLTFVNDAYCRYFNKQRSELIGQAFLPTMPSQDRELISQNFRSLSQGHPINTYEHRIILPNGEVRWQQWSDRALFDEFGNFIECQAVGRDITKLKQAEADIRTALEKEREVNELRSGVVSLVSHEFRTPLTIIQSSTELLEHYSHKLSDKKKLSHFEHIREAVKRMTQLLEDFLTIGKAEAGKLKFKPSSIDLVTCCSQIVENLQISLNSRHTLNFVIEGSCTDAEMDEKLLQHILTNLLSNAIKYSPQGGTINFKLVCRDGHTIFQIKDQGIGIPPDDLDKLFEAFRRASNVSTIPGTGLGLVIVKKCVELHEGKITVESEVGVGTTFTVTLPLNRHTSKLSCV